MILLISPRKRNSGRIRLNSGSDSDSTQGTGTNSTHILSGLTQATVVSGNGSDIMLALRYDVIKKPPENEMEAQRMVNNHMVSG